MGARNIIGIDRLELNNLILLGCNVSIVLRHQSCHITSSREFTAISTEAGLYVQRISICDHSVFHELNIVCIKNTYRTNVSICLNVSEARGSNLYPLNWIEYNAYISEVVLYIEQEYGITLNEAEAKVRAIEITSNLFVHKQYEEYYYCLLLLMSFLPANLSIGTVCGSSAKHLAGSIYRKNKTREHSCKS